MTTLFDTSALILAAREAAVADVLREAVLDDDVAVCELVILEYLNGARNAGEYERFDAGLRASTIFTTEPADWSRALDVHRALAGVGPGHQRSVRIADLIIAAVAERHGATIAHYDEDYDRIAAITGQPTRWLAPKGTLR